MFSVSKNSFMLPFLIIKFSFCFVGATLLFLSETECWFEENVKKDRVFIFIFQI